MINYSELKEIFDEYYKIHNIKLLLEWDKYVNLPKNSINSYIDQINILEKYQKNLLNNKLIQHFQESSLNNIFDVKNFQLMKKMALEENLYSDSLKSELIKSKAKCEFAWREAKEKKDFIIVRKQLSALFSIVNEQANIRGDWLKKSSYEAVIDQYDNGVKLDFIKQNLMSTKKLVLQKIKSTRISNTNCIEELDSMFSVSKTKFFGLSEEIMLKIGFDLNHGRIDVSKHPICWGNKEDVRITSNFNRKNNFSSLYAVIHEAGHGIYLQNLREETKYQPIGQFQGYSTHEAIALLYEYFLCKTDDFLEYLYGMIKKDTRCNKERFFQLNKTHFYSPIRIESEPLYYMLHIIMRYEIEEALFLGKANIEELPDVWEAYYEEYFNIKPIKESCLQDIHWYIGYFGYFPTYGMGLLFSAQLFDQIQRQITSSDNKKYFDSIKEWLKENIFDHGSLYDFEELVIKSTGERLNVNYYINHM